MVFQAQPRPSLRGLLAPSAKSQCMATARTLLATPPANPAAAEADAEFMQQRVVGLDITRCQHCGTGRWLTIDRLALPRSSRIGSSSASDSSQGSPTCRGPP